MTTKDLERATLVIHILAEEYRKTPDEIRQIFTDSFAEAMANADPIGRLGLLTAFPNGKPSAEEIVLQMAHEILSGSEISAHEGSRPGGTFSTFS